MSLRLSSPQRRRKSDTDIGDSPAEHRKEPSMVAETMAAVGADVGVEDNPVSRTRRWGRAGLRGFVRFLIGLIFPAVVLVAWEIAVKAGAIDGYFLPPPSVVADRGWDYLVTTHTAWADLGGSLFRVAVGFALSSVVAVALGLVMGLSKWLDALLGPTVAVLKNIAPIAWIPLAILWFGLGNKPALFLLFIGGFFPVLLSTMGGVQSMERIHLRVAQNVGAKGWRLFSSVILPASLPGIMTGLRVSLGISWMVVIVSEMLAAGNGLGFRLTQAREYGQIDLVLVCMFLVGICGYLFDRITTLLSAYLLRWHGGVHD
jgi:NitT/TauT family transport system permease protein